MFVNTCVNNGIISKRLSTQNSNRNNVPVLHLQTVKNTKEPLTEFVTKYWKLSMQPLMYDTLKRFHLAEHNVIKSNRAG